MKENYQIILNETIDMLKKNGIKPSLLLHSCCAPCSSYVLEYLSEYFSITIFYYNPNISPKEEFTKRVDEQKRLSLKCRLKAVLNLLKENTNPRNFSRLPKV